MTEGLMKLQARPADGGDWIDIYPAQLEWMAREGNSVRAIEIETTHTVGGSAREVTIEECAKCIPTSWLDPLLSGATRIRDLPTLQTEQLLQALAARIRLLAVSRPDREGK